MVEAVMGFLAGVAVVAAMAIYSLRLAKRERTQLIADYDLQIEGMATLHKAAVQSMEEAHTEEVKHWELRASELQEIIGDLRCEVADMRDRVQNALAKARVLQEVVASMETEASDG